MFVQYILINNEWRDDSHAILHLCSIHNEISVLKFECVKIASAAKTISGKQNVNCYHTIIKTVYKQISIKKPQVERKES